MVQAGIEEAIIKALEYEVRVRDLYEKAVTEVEDPVGKRIFKLLPEDEQGHVHSNAPSMSR